MDPFALPAFTKLSSRVWRILGQNPSPMTLGGTNTYLVGTGSKRLLIDTGDAGVKAYHELLFRDVLQWMQSTTSAAKISIDAIVLTHWHHDHVGGVNDILRVFPDAKVYKKPSTISKDSDWLMHSHRCENIMESWPTNPSTGRPTLLVDDNTTLEAIETPGHTDDHVTLRLVEENALFTGDCILGGSSSVFACYPDFMRSLSRLRALEPSFLYPGHGPAVEDAIRRIDEQMSHRVKRESQILACMKHFLTVEGKPAATIHMLVQRVYADTPQHLHTAAAVNVLHNLRKLLEDHKVALGDASCGNGLGVEASQYGASVAAFHSLGAYDGGEGSTLDAAKVESIVRYLPWCLVS